MSSPNAFVAQLDRLARTGVPDVLETMFFATALADQANACDAGAWTVAIAFRGSPSGLFTMRLDRADARALASAFLGREPEQLNAGEDSLLSCELANILCGSVLSRAESLGTFELGAPRLDAVVPDRSDFRAGFLLDTGGALEVQFRLDAEDPA